MRCTHARPRLSSSAKADDPVRRDTHRYPQRPRRTGCPAFAEMTEKTKKIRRRFRLRRIILSTLNQPYAFIFAFTASAVIGNARMRAPQALKMALASAGAITVTAGSPTPVGLSPLAMTLTATSGVWLIRNGV